MEAERLAIVREADAILIEEIFSAGVYREIGQAFAVLLPVKSVGVMGDSRTYENVRIGIRPLTLPYPDSTFSPPRMLYLLAGESSQCSLQYPTNYSGGTTLSTVGLCDPLCEDQ